MELLIIAALVILAIGAGRAARARTGIPAAVAVLALPVLAGCGADAPVPPRVTVTASPHAGGTAGASATSEPGSASTAVPGTGDVDARIVDHASGRYAVVSLPLDAWDVRVDWDPDAGGVMLAEVLEADGDIQVATNAGIFTPELVPGGLLVSDGQELVGLNLADGAGNFHLKPNAVFAILEGGTATVVDSVDYDPAGVVHATQSGPALVLDGQVHPEFREGSTNLALRSGVGVSPEGDVVYLAISTGLTNLWDFATLFRDQLGVEDALYLDGQISDLWVTGQPAPGLLSGPYAGVITATAR